MDLDAAKARLSDTEEELDREKQNAKYHHKNSKEMREEIAVHKRKLVGHLSSMAERHSRFIKLIIVTQESNPFVSVLIDGDCMNVWQDADHIPSLHCYLSTVIDTSIVS